MKKSNYSAEDIVSLSAGRAFREKIGYSKYYICSDGQIFSKKSNKFLSPIKKNTGYYAVNLYNDNGERKMFFIHRLVAELFIPNPENLPCINHKDEDKSNNKIENLEWCSYTYNENYGTKKKREIDKKTAQKRINGHKKIGQYSIQGQLIKIYESLTEAHEITNISIGNISNVLHGRRNTAGGYIWREI